MKNIGLLNIKSQLYLKQSKYSYKINGFENLSLDPHHKRFFFYPQDHKCISAFVITIITIHLVYSSLFLINIDYSARRKPK